MSENLPVLSWEDVPVEIRAEIVERNMRCGILDFGSPVPTHTADGRPTNKGMISRYYQRQTAAFKALCNVSDCGRWGRALELWAADMASKKIAVSPAGKADVRLPVWMTVDGRPIRLQVESKSGGGEITTLWASTKDKYVIYSNHSAVVGNAKWIGKRKRYGLNPVIIPRDIFVRLLARGGRRDNKMSSRGETVVAIQPSNKLLNLFLADYAPRYYPDRLYTAADFEHLYNLVDTVDYPRGIGEFHQN